MKRLRSSSGESIGETLVAMLIITLVFIFLASAVVSAAKANETFVNKDVTFTINGTPQDKGKLTVNLTQTVAGETKTVQIEANKYHVDSGDREEGYDYYEYKAASQTP